MKNTIGISTISNYYIVKFIMKFFTNVRHKSFCIFLIRNQNAAYMANYLMSNRWNITFSFVDSFLFDYEKLL